GMDYFQARYYGSAIGRFTSPDPANIGADQTDPQSWNAYSSARNNPLNTVDPNGMNWWDSLGNALSDLFGGCDATFCATVIDDAPVGTYAWWMNGGWRTVNGGGSGSQGGGPIGEPAPPQSPASPPPPGNPASPPVNNPAPPGPPAGNPAPPPTQNPTPTSPSTKPAGTGPRPPDFISINVNMGLPFLLDLAGPTVQINIAENGHVYIGAGVNVGKGWTLISGSVTANWMSQPQKSQDFLTQNSFSVNGGYWAGVQGSWTPGSGSAKGAGFVSPQVGGAWTYSWDAGKWFGGW
ncbi:MAG: RHS repeat-associated core domain-containing protein, partial [Bryobacteraceae bacterium]